MCVAKVFNTQETFDAQRHVDTIPSMVEHDSVVHVNVAPQAYDIRIARGLIDAAGRIIEKIVPSRRLAIVCDAALVSTHAQRLDESLRRYGFSTHVVPLVGGEENKSLEALLPAFDSLLRWKVDRSTPLLALGGGLIGDMTGFLAATILRGVPFIQMPTTLLAMVDASVGGKTGVNHAVGKNLIGAFHQPAAVLIDPDVLTTLPDRQLCSGLAECIKHACIRDADELGRLEATLPVLLSRDMSLFARLIAHNVSIKARVVEADPFERGERAHLNFGHTFGHAIENVSHYHYTHGECVALGMCAAADLSVSVGLLSPSDRDRIVSVVRLAGLPVSGLRLPVASVVDAMAYDKKASAGGLRFVLLDRIGHAVVRDQIPLALIERAVEFVRG